MLKLKDWINKGGILIRFSDKNMIENRDIFLDGKKIFSIHTKYRKRFIYSE